MFGLEQGVVQGCSLSPIIFSVSIDDLLREVEKADRGIQLGVVRRWEGCSLHLLMIS